MAKTKHNRNSDMDSDGHDMDIRSIMKDIQMLGSSHMTWKEKKELENRKVVALGGKPPKKQKLPLTMARFVMKKQKQREQKVLEENLILGRFKHRNGNEGSANKRRPEDRVLKSIEGNFRKGVLDVKHMLRRPTSSGGEEDSRSHKADSKQGMKKKGGAKKHGKSKGGGKKRH